MTPAEMTAPGSVIITPDELLSVLDALDYAANDYAYRAELVAEGEDVLARYGADEDEAKGYADKAAALSQMADRLRDRAGIEVDRS